MNSNSETWLIFNDQLYGDAFLVASDMSNIRKVVVCHFYNELHFFLSVINENKQHNGLIRAQLNT